MTIAYRILIILTAISLAHCVDKINLLNTDNARSMLVIDARMVKYKEKGLVMVDLIQSSLNTDRSFGFIADEVSLINASGNKLVIDRYAIGRYATSETPTFKFIYGEKYKIRVFNNNGDVYESSWAELNQSPVINKASFDYSEQNDNNKENLSLFVNTTINSNLKNKIIKWDVVQTYQFTEQKYGGIKGKICYIPEKLDKTNIKFIDGRVVEKDKPIDFLVSKKGVNYYYAEGSYFTIVQEAIDLNVQRYYTAYNNLVQREGNIFETPPGMLPTNFKCVSDSTKLVSGYFYATQQDTIRIFVSPNDVGTPARLCPIPPNEASDCPVAACCNCLNAKNSTAAKPFYWK